MRLRSGTILTAILASMLAGCSSNATPTRPATSDDAAPTVASSPSSSSTTNSTADIKRYFTAFDGTNPDQFRRVARAVTAPGSLAAGYATQQAGQTDAYLDGGGVNVAQTRKSLSNGDEQLCTKNDNGSNMCTRFGNFNVDAHGKLASFTIDRKSLKGRLIMGNGLVQHTPLGNIKLMSAYVTQGGELSVVTRVTTKSEKIIFGQNGTTYRDTTGRQRNASSDFSGPGDVAPHSLANENLFFQGPIKLGGTLTIDLTKNGGDYQSSFVKMKIG